ncbi:MAG: hypothetical protein ACI38A_04095, partial [Candidatus Ornithomonoglobus sp.]
KYSFIAPYNIEEIKKIYESLALSKSDFKRIFTDAVKTIRISLPFGSVNSAWNTLNKSIGG